MVPGLGTPNGEYQDQLIELSASSINQPLDQVDTAIDVAFGTIGRYVGADCMNVFAHNLPLEPQATPMKGAAPQMHELRSIPLESVPGWVNPQARGEVIHIPDVSTQPENSIRDWQA